MMPNKTIYVSDTDAPLFDRAQDLAGGNLSAAIAQALRRYVESEENAESGEIVVKVGSQGAYRQQRFIGRQVSKYYVVSEDQTQALLYRVYHTNKGNFAVYIREMPNWTGRRGPPPSDEMIQNLQNLRDRMNWGMRRRGGDGPEWQQYANGWWAPTSRLEVYPSLEELQAHIPAELFTAVSAAIQNNGIEDLDI